MGGKKMFKIYLRIGTLFLGLGMMGSPGWTAEQEGTVYRNAAFDEPTFSQFKNQLESMTLKELHALRAMLGESVSPEERKAFRQVIRGRFNSMTPEERADFRQQNQERFESMLPEERADFRQQNQERFESMTSEEREGFRQQRQERMESMGLEGGARGGMHRRR